MSNTTTIRLPADLKARVAAAAERAGTTTHSFILDAIAKKVDAEERRNDFHQAAEEAVRANRGIGQGDFLAGHARLP